jgi:hypothetical protein
VLGANGATPQRLAAAVRAALGHVAPHGLLSPAEQELIAGDLFPAAYRQQVTANLVRLDAVLGELAANTSGGWPQQKSARYTCVAMNMVARSAADEVLTALVMQWLTVQVSTAITAPPAVIIAGADEISRPHAERLSDACERRGVPLTFMFRHLRDDAARLIGGGTAAFMRLPKPRGGRAGCHLHRAQAHLRRPLLHRHPRREPEQHPGQQRRIRHQ